LYIINCHKNRQYLGLDDIKGRITINNRTNYFQYYKPVSWEVLNLRVLIIDDSRFVLQIVKKAIIGNIEGIEILTASNGVEGYAAYQEYNPDAIITDLLMPEMNGRDLAENIRRNDKSTKIIVLSADIQKTTREEMQKIGISAFINKPINEEKIAYILSILREENHAE